MPHFQKRVFIDDFEPSASSERGPPILSSIDQNRRKINQVPGHGEGRTVKLRKPTQPCPSAGQKDRQQVSHFPTSNY